MPKNITSVTIIVALEGMTGKEKNYEKQNILKNISSTNAPRK